MISEYRVENTLLLVGDCLIRFVILYQSNELIHTQNNKWLAEQIVCFFLISFYSYDDGPYNFGHFPVSPKLNFRN